MVEERDGEQWVTPHVIVTNLSPFLDVLLDDGGEQRRDLHEPRHRFHPRILIPERRINDYLESYRGTGRSPPPCPPHPPDPAARVGQRLPPLFVPTPFSALDQFVSISCRPEFAGHSVEVRRDFVHCIHAETNLVALFISLHRSLIPQELHLSFLRTDAELTSTQTFSGLTAAPTVAPTSPLGGAQPQPPGPAPSVFGQPVQSPVNVFGAHYKHLPRRRALVPSTQDYAEV
ncbi:hypothetical protein DFH09DRAFT_1317821 [Mycena vulgaris]|nr:hypothetical protein DFH09DRAFT_1317821 [Mycena vulgaris]